VNRIAAQALVAVMSSAAALSVGVVGTSAPAFAMPAQVSQPAGKVATSGTSGTRTPSATCPTTVPTPITPVRIAMAHVTRGAPVIAPPRVNGVPGTPPLTSYGKHVVAWDRAQHIKPGALHGNVLMNAHVWPDGSAIGNAMLRKLHKGDRIVVFGKNRKLCYRVVDRVQLRPTQGLRRYYSRIGAPQLAIVTCSGRRIAPGVWTMRTIWYARPSV
jgi:hypothetical protein